MKIGIVSLGCSKNLVDTQNALSFLKASGHEFVSDPAKAEAIIVNTCGFINDAKKESVDTILEMAEYKQAGCRYLVVMGCLVQRYRKQLEQELPEVDRFISIDEYGDLENIFNGLFSSRTICGRQIVLATDKYTAYLRIADGCDNRCAFCAIPLIRGDYRSQPFEEILQEAARLEKMGVRELNIIAQDTTRYGRDLYGRFRLHELLKKLDQMDFHWIRVLYMYPDEIYDELLQTIRECHKVLPYFDIPIQHGSDRLLNLMNRRGTRKTIETITAKIREMYEDPTLRTTLIVGFPTETDEDFRQLMELTEEIRWDRMGAFTYSREEDTTSYDMQPQVDEEIAHQRLDELMKLQREISLENNSRYVGKSIEVLVEKTRTPFDANYRGRGKMHAPDDVDGHVFFTSDRPVSPGEFVKVTIERAGEYDLYGHLTD